MASRYSLGEITTTVRYLEPIKWGELTLFVFSWFLRIIFDLTSARYPYCVFPFPYLTMQLTRKIQMDDFNEITSQRSKDYLVSRSH